MADRERRAVAGDHDRRRVILEHHRERIGARDPPQHGEHRVAPPVALASEPGQQLRDDLGVGLRGELSPSRDQFVLDLGKVLDDAVVHDGNAIGEMGVRIAFRRCAMRRPAGVSDADRSGERFFGKPRLEIDQLALRPPAIQPPVEDGGDAGRIIAAILEPLQCLHQPSCDWLCPDDADNTAHETTPLLVGPHGPQSLRQRCGSTIDRHITLPENPLSLSGVCGVDRAFW